MSDDSQIIINMATLKGVLTDAGYTDIHWKWSAYPILNNQGRWELVTKHSNVTICLGIYHTNSMENKPDE